MAQLPHDALVDEQLTSLVTAWSSEFALQLTNSEQTSLIDKLRTNIPSLGRRGDTHKHFLEFVEGVVDPAARSFLPPESGPGLHLARLSVPGGWVYTINETPIYVPKPQEETDEEAAKRVLYIAEDGAIYDETGKLFGKAAFEEPAPVPQDPASSPNNPVLLKEYANILADATTLEGNTALAVDALVDVNPNALNLDSHDWAKVAGLLFAITASLSNDADSDWVRDILLFCQMLEIPKTAQDAQTIMIDVLFKLNDRVHGAPAAASAS